MKRIKILFLILITVSFSSAFGSEDFRRSVNLEWEEVLDASSYEVKVTRITKGGERQKPFSFTTKQPKWSGDIKPGKYEMVIRSYDDRGVPGEWSDAAQFLVKLSTTNLIAPKANQKIKTKEDEEFKAEFKWGPVEGAESYQLQVKSLDSDFSKTLNVDGTDEKLNLKVAEKYEWKVSAVLPNGDLGEDSEASPFTLIAAPIDKPKITEPTTRLVKALEWKPSERAQSYNYALLRKDPKTKKWIKIEKESKFDKTKIPFDLSRPGGTYKFIVQAHAKNTESSAVSKIVFNAEGNLRTPAAIKAAELQDSIEKPSSFYGIASYYITQVTYKHNRPTSNEGGSQFDNLSGTGRIGLGYQKPQAPWGVYGVVDLGGFTYGKDTIMFSSLEIHGTWKQRMKNGSLLTYSGGLYNKELPELYGIDIDFDNAMDQEDVRVVSAGGVHAGVSYWKPTSAKWGYQLNARLYFPLMGGNIIQGELEGEPSYLIGALGSYRLNKKWMGFGGYSYRHDFIGYVPGDGSSNGAAIDTTIDGHYINLKLEYSF